MERSTLHERGSYRLALRTAPFVAGLLVVLLAGCYTQLGTVQYERIPDYVEVVQSSEDTVVTEHYYNDQYLYSGPYSYRRYFDRFDYGWSPRYYRDPYSSYSSFYGSSWYDPWGYNSRGYDPWGYSPWGYGYNSF